MRIAEWIIFGVAVCAVPACGSNGSDSARRSANGTLPAPDDQVPSVAAGERSILGEQADDPLPEDADQSVSAAIPNSLPTESMVSSSEPLVEEGLMKIFGEKCLAVDAVSPTNTVPVSIPLDAIPSPIEETGVRIGPYAGQEFTPVHPSTLRYWMSVAIDDAVVGYLFIPSSNREDPPETMDPDCHPEVAIYDEDGILIGSFVDELPVIIDTSAS